MLDALLLVAVFATAYLGFALLAISQARHWRQVTAAAPLPVGRIKATRVAGSTLIATSLVLALVRDGPSFGSLLWATAISLAALAVALTLSLRPHWLRAIAAARPKRRIPGCRLG